MKHPGRYMYAAHEETLYIKLVGECNYANCGDLERMISEITQKHPIQQIVFDLSEADWLDSTVMGHIASVVRSKKLKGKVPIIITRNPDILHLLKSLSFDQYFKILSESPNISEEFKELEPSVHSMEELAESILHAHRNLIELDEKNLEKFRDVIDLLERELQNQKKT